LLPQIAPLQVSQASPFRRLRAAAGERLLFLKTPPSCTMILLLLAM
jgi:hypothetical protein